MKKTTRFERELRQFEDEMTRRRWRPNTRRAYVRGVRLFLDWIERTNPIAALDEVNEETLLAWRDELKSWSVVPSTQALRLAGVKSFFYLLASIGVLRSDPASEVFNRKEGSPCRPPRRDHAGGSGIDDRSRKRLCAE